jgi:hypothetical protein
MTSDRYFMKKKISSGDAVYVATPDLPFFITNRFLSLPQETRIILVTGSEDIGAPVEIFNPNRENFFVSH